MDCYGSNHRPISVEFLNVKGVQLRSKRSTGTG